MSRIKYGCNGMMRKNDQNKTNNELTKAVIYYRTNIEERTTKRKSENSDRRKRDLKKKRKIERKN